MTRPLTLAISAELARDAASVAAWEAFLAGVPFTWLEARHG